MWALARHSSFVIHSLFVIRASSFLMTIYFVAGETSADNHGAALMSSLRRREVGLNFIGRGGPQMRAIAGERFKDWLGDAAVLGLWEVIRKYGYFREHFRETLKEIQKS
jgi:lipid-A-disaccharide synthase